MCKLNNSFSTIQHVRLTCRKHKGCTFCQRVPVKFIKIIRIKCFVTQIYPVCRPIIFIQIFGYSCLYFYACLISIRTLFITRIKTNTIRSLRSSIISNFGAGQIFFGRNVINLYILRINSLQPHRNSSQSCNHNSIIRRPRNKSLCIYSTSFS